MRVRIMRMSQSNLVAAVLASLSVTLGSVGVSSVAKAQGENDTGYQQPLGEQPDFEKKYRPTVPNHDLVLELNPLLLINRSIAVEIEKRMGDAVTLGGDLVYRDALVFDEKDIKGRVQFLGVAPKVRFYPFQPLSGFFFGAKLTLGQTNLSLKSKDVTTEKGILTISPTAHVGYRFATHAGFTMAAYVGGGINVPKPELEKKDLKEENRESDSWNDGRDSVNNATGLFRPDIGLTLGIAL